jgi:hypothetical protein
MWIWLNLIVYSIPLFEIVNKSIYFDIERQLISFFVLGIVPGTSLQLNFSQIGMTVIVSLLFLLTLKHFELRSKISFRQKNKKDLSLISI